MTSERWTVRRTLRWMTDDFERVGLNSPRLDAELLIAESLKCKRVQLYLDLDRPLTADELAGIRGLLVRRRRHEPVAYILKQREFYGRPFHVDSRVLIPRPDSEVLVDQALEALPDVGSERRVLDLCTGSGCIGLTLAAERPAWRVQGADISEGAIEVALRNAESLGLAERVEFLIGDLWEAVPKGVRYDLIVCNPPYVTHEEWSGLEKDVTDYEPKSAFVADDLGLSFYRRCVERAPDFLATGGSLLFEVGHRQAGAVSELCSRGGFVDTKQVRDLNGVLRVVLARTEKFHVHPT